MLGAADGHLSARSRLVSVSRLLSLLVALTVAGSSAAPASLHVHGYGGGHDHPEHRHGPASHSHDHDHGVAASVSGEREHHDDHDTHGDDRDLDAVRIEACDAGDHAVRIPGAAAPRPHVHLQLAVLSDAIAIAPATPARLTLAPIEVRVHGPPTDMRLPARAPPLTFLA
jgi:hypothetical protein